jgi:hypothetical protein
VKNPTIVEGKWNHYKKIAAVLEGFSGGFKPPQSPIVTVGERLYILGSALYIATVLQTAVQTVVDYLASDLNCRNRKKHSWYFEPFCGGFEPSWFSKKFLLD